MAVKDGAGPRPAAQTAKRCFLNCLETSFKPCFFYLPSCSANCQLACVVLQLAFVLHGSGQGTPSQGSNTMAVKDGAGPRLAAQTAKRCFLNCLETSFKPCFFLPSARVLPLATCNNYFLHLAGKKLAPIQTAAFISSSSSSSSSFFLFFFFVFFVFFFFFLLLSGFLFLASCRLLLVIASAFLLLVSSFLLLALAACNDFLALAAGNFSSDALPLLQAGSADLYY